MSIKKVQNNLISLGYGEYLRPYGADGVEGNKTKKAVKLFQADYNRIFKKKILVDGIGRDQTIKAQNDWLKNVGTKGTKNFNISEFKCKGTGTLLKRGMDRKLMTGLEKLRYKLGGNPITVTSGYRSVSHNKNVGGAKNSQHLYGKAADIKVANILPSRVYNESLNLFDGIGKYRSFTHVDTRGYKARF